MEITTAYQKERHDFGRSIYHLAFSSVDILEEFAQEPELLKEHIERDPTILDIQAIPDMSECYVNTETVSYKSIGMLHLEGGWPKEVDPTEKEQTQYAAPPHALIATRTRRPSHPPQRGPPSSAQRAAAALAPRSVG